MPAAEVDEEVTSILTDIDLLDKADAIAEKLSGGQKRKLSVGKRFTIVVKQVCTRGYGTVVDHR